MHFGIAVEEKESEKVYERYVEDAISLNKTEFRRKLLDKIETDDKFEKKK
jgi:hypothetical protein